LDLKPLQAVFLYLVGLASSVALLWIAGLMALFLPY